MKSPLIRPTFTVPLGMSRAEATEEIRGRLVARQDLAGRWRGKDKTECGLHSLDDED